MIHRDVAAATAEPWDLVIIGGGVYGIMAALEAVRWGRRPLLLEMDDFGGATSANSLRIVHGGLRYLQTGDLERFRESVAERSWFLSTFPDLVEPLECAMPLYNRGLRRRPVMRLALMANDFLSRHRNDGVSSERALANGRLLSAAETLRRFPALPAEGLTGSAVWFDAAMNRFQRVLIEILHWASLGGAAALNYARVERLVLDSDNGRVAGVVARDLHEGDEFEVRSPIVLNCAGPWSGRLARHLGAEAEDLFAPSLAFNLLLDRPPIGDAAIAIAPPGPGARTYFMYPWGPGTLAGTFHAPWDMEPGEGDPPQELIAEFVADLDSAVPQWGIQMADVRRVLWGLLPVREPGTVELSVRPKTVDHGAAGGPAGFFSIAGVKFTTSRRVAEETMRRIFGPLMPSGGNLPPRPTPADVPSASAAAAMLRDAPDSLGAVIRRLASEEAVIVPEDLVHRRTDWGLDPDVAARFLPHVRDALHDASRAGGSPTA